MPQQDTPECQAVPQAGDVYYPVLLLCSGAMEHKALPFCAAQTPLATTAPLEPFQNVLSDDELNCQGTQSKDSNHGSVCSSCQIHSQHPLKSIFLGNVNAVSCCSLKIRLLPAPRFPLASTTEHSLLPSPPDSSVSALHSGQSLI